MPIYEYQCLDCEMKFEFFIWKKDEVPQCPKCDSKNLEKQASSCNAQFKGRGFHKTDYNKFGRKR
jgi:putative FmdB family regulatory protein